MGKLSSFRKLKTVLARWEKWWTRKAKAVFDRMGYNGESK